MSDPENGDIIENPEPEADTEGEGETDDPEGQYGVISVNDGEGAEHVTETRQDNGSGDHIATGACVGSSSDIRTKAADNFEHESNSSIAEEPEGDCFGAAAQSLNCDCTEADSEISGNITTDSNVRTSSDVSEYQVESTEDDIEADLIQGRIGQDLTDRSNYVPESEKDLQFVGVDNSVQNKDGEKDQNLNAESDCTYEDITDNSVHNNQSVDLNTQEDQEVTMTTDNELCPTSVAAADAGVRDLPEDESLFVDTCSENIECVSNNTNNVQESEVTMTESKTVTVDESKVPEDEIGTICFESANSRLSVLSPAESVESYEPECDQESECVGEMNMLCNSPGSSEMPAESNSGAIACKNVCENGDSNMPNEPSGSNNFQGQGCVGYDNSVIGQVVNCTNGPTVENNSSRADKTLMENSDNKHENFGNVLSSENRNSNRSEINFETSELPESSFQNSSENLNNVLSDSENLEVKQESFKDQDSNKLDDDLLSELESELGPSSETVTLNLSSGEESNSQLDNLRTLNGVSVDAKIVQQCKDLQDQLKQMKEELQLQMIENERLKTDNEENTCLLQNTLQERDSYLQEINIMKTRNHEDFYLPQIKELEYTIAQQQNEIRGLKEKLTSHDTAAKRAISTLQGELKIRIDQVTKMYDDANKEKDAMVVKYAQAEKKSLESQKMIERLECKVRDGIKEKETLIERFKDIKAEKKKLQADLDTKAAEIHSMSKDLDKQREMLSSTDVRIKWAQNKLKTELEAHKETKTSLEKTTQKLKEAKEETEQIRRDCQAMIKTYQESEEMKSVNLDQELKVKETQLKLHEQEKSDQEEVYSKTVQELEQLKIKHRETLSELETYRDKSQCLETERHQNEETINRYKDIMQKQKKDNRELQERIEKLIQVQSDFKRAQNTIKSLDAEITELKISNKDLVIDMEACRKRESEKLELTEKLSAKNAELQSENTNLSNKVLTYSGDLQNLRMKLQELETKQEEAIHTLTEEKRNLQQEIETSSSKLEEKSKAVEELTIRIEDQKDEMKTLKRKHVNNIKDLTRELQQTRRKLESYESNGDNKDRNSMGSRTSSNGSLNTVGVSEGTNSHAPPSVSIHNHNHVNAARQSSPPEQVIQEYPVITEQVEPDKQLLIERIVKLQRALARKNEKIEFVNDHISQLVDEIQKKNKIIQNYALREEAGTLTPEVMDINKAQLSRKHSIMSSVYSSHSTDGSMTLDLSLEINRKLQAVLEDTLLKNITLKESLDTLGQEIARLSQENRNLQLQFQDKKQKR